MTAELRFRKVGRTKYMLRAGGEGYGCGFCDEQAVAAVVDPADDNSMGVCPLHFDRQIAEEEGLRVVVFHGVSLQRILSGAAEEGER